MQSFESEKTQNCRANFRKKEKKRTSDKIMNHASNKAKVMPLGLLTVQTYLEPQL